MRKLVVLVTLVLVMSTAVYSSADDDVHREWTLIFYMGGDGRPDYISDAVDDDLLELSDIAMDHSVSIIVLTDQKEFGDSRLIEIKDGEKHDLPLSLVNESWGLELDMSHKQTLRDFVGWARENYQAERYLLNLWGHGSGWRGMNLEDYERLTLPDMGMALEGYHFDIIGFDSCTMGMLEVYHQLREHGKILVAAEKEVPLAGWPYTRILERLNENPAMNSSELATVIVNEFVDWGAVHSSLSTTLTALRSSELPIDELDSYSYELELVVPMYLNELKSAWEKTDSYTPFPYPRDLYHFSMNVHHEVDSMRLRRAGMELRDAINRSIVAHRVHSTSRDPLYNAHGIGIYLPSEFIASEYSTLDFAEHGWNRWLNRFVDPPEPYLVEEIEFVVTVDEENISFDLSHELRDAQVEVDVYLDNGFQERYSITEGMFDGGMGVYDIELYVILDGQLVFHRIEEVLMNASFAIYGNLDTVSELYISVQNSRTGEWKNFSFVGGNYSLYLSVPGFCVQGDTLNVNYRWDGVSVDREVTVDGDSTVVDLYVNEGYQLFIWALLSQMFVVAVMAISYYQRKKRASI